MVTEVLRRKPNSNSSIFDILLKLIHLCVELYIYMHRYTVRFNLKLIFHLFKYFNKFADTCTFGLCKSFDMLNGRYNLGFFEFSTI